MSRSLSSRLRRRADDEGFSLVEILVAMTIFAIIVIATAPLLVGGLKAGRAAQLNLQGKALAQERLELLRNLPFHVARQNGQYLDVLDIYYRDLQPTGALAVNDRCSARSYNAATRTYSCTITNLGSDYPGFSQVVQMTFLDFQRNTVIPPSTYNSQTAGLDSPASTLLGVAVTTSWTQGGRTSNYTLRSQLANAEADQTTIRTSLEVSALVVTSSLADTDVLQLKAGLLSGEGSLTTGSTANLTATTARAGKSSGASIIGASQSLTAPPAKVGTSPSDPSGYQLDGSCDLACFGQTGISGNQNVTVNLGKPQVSSAADPVLTALRRSGSNIYRGFSFSNAESTQVDSLLRLATGPMVSAGLGSTTEVVNSKGYLDANGSGATAVTAVGQAAVPVVQLFPTDFAPEGVVQLALTSSSLTCTSGGGSGAVTATWAGEVRHWQQTGVNSLGQPTGSYVVRTVAPGSAPLPDLATTLVLKADADGDGLVDGAGADVALTRWVKVWSGLSNPADAITSVGKQTTGSVSAVISVITAPTRALDATSAINLAVGSLKCHAEDNR